jgi:hypothetical protein
MLRLFRFAGIITVILAVSGSARAQAIAPAGSGVTIERSVIDNGTAHSVKYFVKGGSPQLQALVRRVEWAENELSMAEQLQGLKLDTVINERRAAAVRATQLTSPYYPGFIPYSTDNGVYSTSHLQRALTGQLAYAATPQAHLQLIGYLERMQSELDAELKKLAPKEQEAAQRPIDALRPRLAALAGTNVPPPQPQPIVSWRSPEEAPPAPAPAGAKPAVEVEWHGSWYAAEVLRVNGGSTLIHYTGWASSWDEWVPVGRIRPAGAASAPPQPSTPSDSVALEQTVRKYQETVRQRIVQMQQQLVQGHEETAPTVLTASHELAAVAQQSGIEWRACGVISFLPLLLIGRLANTLFGHE